MWSVDQSGSHACAKYTGRYDEIPSGREGYAGCPNTVYRAWYAVYDIKARLTWLQLVVPLVIDVLRTITHYFRCHHSYQNANVLLVWSNPLVHIYPTLGMQIMLSMMHGCINLIRYWSLDRMMPHLLGCNARILMYKPFKGIVTFFCSAVIFMYSGDTSLLWCDSHRQIAL